MGELGHNVEPALVLVAQRIVDWIKKNSDEVVFGRGAKDGSIGAAFKRGNSRFLAVQLFSSGVVALNFGYLKAPFDGPGLRQGWVDRIRALPGIILPADAGNKWPNIRLMSLASPLDGFLAAMDWLAKQLRDVA